MPVCVRAQPDLTAILIALKHEEDRHTESHDGTPWMSLDCGPNAQVRDSFGGVGGKLVRFGALHKQACHRAAVLWQSQPVFSALILSMVMGSSGINPNCSKTSGPRVW